jgi:predicted alpha/beta-fold hydrolase
MSAHRYRPAWWLPGAHLQTLWGKLVRRRPIARAYAERWPTPDGDFLDLHRLDAPPGRPRLVVLHGLEGSPRSHYAVGLVAEADRRGWAADVITFRSCGHALNRTLRFYHAGETGDLELVLQRLIAAEPGRPVVLAGVSLGGNVLLKWLGERGHSAPGRIVAAAAISVPFDLARGARHIDRGFSRVYQAYFLRSLRRKARAKSRSFPDRIRVETIRRARTLYAFDDVVTAPIHGFRDADDYYAQSSSIRWIEHIRVPTLLLNAVDDPFLPPDVLERVNEVAARNPWLVVEFVQRGGHAGFVCGTRPWRPVYYAEWRSTEFLAERLAARERIEGSRTAG